MKIRKTKIVCTIGPTCEDLPTIKRLLEAGLNIARFNFSHGSHDEHRRRIETVLQASKETGIPVATLLDTKGPQLRTCATLNNEHIVLKEGEIFTLTTDDTPGTNKHVSVNHHLLPAEVSTDTMILIADGLIELAVLETSDDTITCKVITGGSFGSNKNLNVIGAKISLPTVTEADAKDIAFGASMNMDFIAASFIQTADDVRTVQKVLDQNNSHMGVIAKIETNEAIENIHSIVLASRGIMVARGDLGVQLKTEEVPLAQKTIIRLCNQYGRAVITATQMLESMITNPRPTRAEATDVANAIFDGTDAIMLSAETANGKYPVEAVQTMNNIALNVEQSREYKENSKRYFELHKDVNSVGSAVAKSACMLAADTNSSVIIAPTLRGNSPRMLSQFRPPQIIVATTIYETVHRHLLIYWGVYPYLLPNEAKDIEHIINASIATAQERDIVKKYDFVTITAGLPLGSPVMLNTAEIRFVGTILQRGSQGHGTSVEGVVYNIRDIHEARQFIKDKEDIILVCETLDADDFQLLRHVQGIICTSYLRGINDLIYSNPHIVIVADIHSKSTVLQDGQAVGLSGTEKIVYKIETSNNEPK